MVKPRYKAEVNKEKCLSCGECISVCPNDAIFMIAGKADVSKNSCVGCGICIKTCPVAAIFEV